MRIGIIGESENYISHSMLSSSLMIDEVEVVWFISAEIDDKLRKKLYGPSLDLGLFGKTYSFIASVMNKRTKYDCSKICRENRVTYVKPKEHSINTGLPNEMYEDSQVDFVLIAGCDQLLNESGLKLARKKVINYHYSPLPAYRGKFVLFWQWYNREQHFGYSFHEVDLGVDTGKVIFQGSVPRVDAEPLGKATQRVVLASSNDLEKVFKCLNDNSTSCFMGKIESSYYPSRKFQQLIVIDKSKSMDDVKELIERGGSCRLTNGLSAGKLINTVKGDFSEYSIDNNGIYVPVRDGIVLMRPFPRIHFFLVRLLCGDNKLLGGLS